MNINRRFKTKNQLINAYSPFIYAMTPITIVLIHFRPHLVLSASRIASIKSLNPFERVWSESICQNQIILWSYTKSGLDATWRAMDNNCERNLQMHRINIRTTPMENPIPWTKVPRLIQKPAPGQNLYVWEHIFSRRKHRFVIYERGVLTGTILKISHRVCATSNTNSLQSKDRWNCQSPR